jgi:hypothetical protein
MYILLVNTYAHQLHEKKPREMRLGAEFAMAMRCLGVMRLQLLHRGDTNDASSSWAHGGRTTLKAMRGLGGKRPAPLKASKAALDNSDSNPKS